MEVITTVSGMRQIAERERRTGRTIGVVPTMGYLHEGHAALMRHARRENDVVILTVFVNPTQFGPNEDYDKYPRDITNDEEYAGRAGVDYIFLPSVREIYPDGFSTYIDPGPISERFEGASRPKHFKGVATVVLKLFNITQPHRAYFGQKDAQQIAAVRKMVGDLNLPVEIRRIPTVREQDGLALSSRNIYLSEQERRKAASLYAALNAGERRFQAGERSAPDIIAAVRDTIASTESIAIDYITLVDSGTFCEANRLIKGNEYCLALAARIGTTRLIDNILLSENDKV